MKVERLTAGRGGQGNIAGKGSLRAAFFVWTENTVDRLTRRQLRLWGQEVDPVHAEEFNACSTLNRTLQMSLHVRVL